MDGLDENASAKDLILLGNSKSLFLKAYLPRNRKKKRAHPRLWDNCFWRAACLRLLIPHFLPVLHAFLFWEQWISYWGVSGALGVGLPCLAALACLPPEEQPARSLASLSCCRSPFMQASRTENETKWWPWAFLFRLESWLKLFPSFSCFSLKNLLKGWGLCWRCAVFCCWQT